MHLRALSLFIFLSFSLNAFSQYNKGKREPSTKEAKDNFTNGNYRAALEEYLLLYKTDSLNPLYNFRIGVSYLNTNIDKSKAVFYLENALKSNDYKKEGLKELAKAYHVSYRFDDAIKTYTLYKEALGGGSKTENEQIDHEIETCHHAKELVKFPLNVSFENPGKEVNTEYPDYYPHVTQDESTILFTTRRKGTTGGYPGFDGYFTSDIFFSAEKGGKWTKAKNAGPALNTSGDDEAAGVSPEGEYVVIYSENEFEYGDIFFAGKKGKTYLPRVPFDAAVNTPDLEVAGSLTDDGNTLFFSSNKPDGKGAIDIYVTRKLPSGLWGTPLNIEEINTPYNEDFPMITKDGKTLYFASQGHNGMGGFDVFKSLFNEATQTWGKAVNLGYPLNTPEDNMTISFTGDKRYAYISALRKEGLGDLDIYRVTFNAVEPQNSVIKGLVQAEIPIDYNEYKNIHYYKNADTIKGFPDAYKPGVPWVFIETKKITVKEGFTHRFILTFEKDGVSKNFDEKNIPAGDSAFVFKDIKIVEAKKAGYVIPPNRPLFKTEPVSNAIITLYDNQTKDLVGTYSPIPNTGRYVIIAPSGTYDLEVEADGYPLYSETFKVLDKASFEPEIKKDIILKFAKIK